MKVFSGRTAVLTGAASGLGLALAHQLAREGMHLVLADIQPDALEAAATDLRGLGVQVLAQHVDVSKAEQVEALGAATLARFGVPSLVFNNAGVGTSGLIWEHSPQDWAWVLGVNLMGVVHGVRVFTPLMLDAASREPGYEGHIVNTASMAGLLNAPNMGVYNVSKHAVVSLSETLFQDLRLMTDRISASVLCPYFVPTGIHRSERNRPADLANAAPATRSQQVGAALGEKAVASGKVSATQVALGVLDAIRNDQFYIYSHAQMLGPVQTRLEDVVRGRNPSDPYQDRPELGARLRALLRA